MSLEHFRSEIDSINPEIVEAVAKRMEVVEKIGEYKEENGLEVKDEEREEKVKNQFAEMFEESNLPSDNGIELAELLIDMAVDDQR